MTQSIRRATLTLGLIAALIAVSGSSSAVGSPALPGPFPTLADSSPDAGVRVGEGSGGAPSSSGRGAARALLQPGPGKARYIVVFKRSVEHPAALARSQARSRGGEISLLYRHAIEGYAATLPESEVAALRRDPRVKHVTRDRVVRRAEQGTPTGIERSFAVANEGLAIDASDNRRVAADVAVIDSGIDPEHPDLNVVARTDCVPPHGGFFPGIEPEYGGCADDAGRDGHGHGTHVAGTIGALDNGEGVVGIAPGARLWAVKALADENFGLFSWVIAGVDWVTEHSEQIEVANMSLAGPAPQPALDEAIAASVQAGVAYVVAAGNSGADAEGFSPAGNSDAITVSALADYDGKAGGEAEPTCADRGPDDTLADFSNYGEAVEVAAPGVCILSTLPTTGSYLGQDYGTLSGTSMASPHVAGAAAILASESNPEDEEDVEAIRDALLEAGSEAWEDTSGDGTQEPLLDVGEETTFAPSDQVAVTGEVEALSPEEATLHGLVNPAGIETEYRFEYGTTTEYGTSVPVSGGEAGSGGEYAPVEETVEGLEGQTPYHYRLVATNEKGTFHGEDRVFATTPPSVQAEAASDVGASEAVLSASVDPEGLDTTYRFEYGTTTSYGRVSPRFAAKPIGSGAEAVELAEAIGGLDDDRTYHFRVVAESLAGRVHGEDRSFTTERGDWVEQEAVNPDVEGEESDDTQLNDVSCTGASECMAVGNVYVGVSPSGHNEAFAERWDGEEWSTLPIPYPEGTDSQTVLDVSCPAPDRCVAVGLGHQASEPTIPLLARWDGAEWALETAPLPAGVARAELRGVECATESECVAVGAADSAVGGQPEQAFALHWDGDEWTIDLLSPPGESSQLNDVSCAGAGTCMAVGWSYTGQEPDQPLALSWDGQSWEATETPPGEEPPEEGILGYNFLVSVSCWAADGCVASLGFRDGVERWDGDEWALESLSHPGGAYFVAIGENGLSCVASGMCIATGSYGAGYAYVPFTASLEGGEWSLRPASDPTAGDESPGWGSAFTSASCLSASRCVGAGAHSIPGGEQAALVERFRPAGPAAVTEPASEVGVTTATLNATVNPNGSATDYRFEYGPTTEYGSFAPAEPEAIGSGGEDVAVEQAIEALNPDTTYHFRVVATNEEGTTKGEDRQFTTPSVQAFGEKGSGDGQFKSPSDAAVDSEGNVWVTDTENNRIQKFDPTGQYLAQAGEAGTGNGQLVYPWGIAVDSEDNVWVTDAGNNRVQKFDSGGEYVSQFGEEGSGNGQLSFPTGIAVNSEDNLWVADTFNNRVQKFDSEGEYLDQFGEEGSGDGRLNFPTGIAVDSESNIWVADTFNNRVQRFDSEGEYLSQLGEAGSGNGELNTPMGLAFSPEGSLWVADTVGNRVQEFGPAGNYLAKRGAEGSEVGELKEPRGLAVSAEGDLWVADTGNDRIQLWPHSDAPGATTDPASVWLSEDATLKATIRPRGLATTYGFQYGTSAEYGSTVPASPESAGSGTGEVQVEEPLEGLTPETTYHYRVVASNAAGTSYGEDMTFTTKEADARPWGLEGEVIPEPQQIELDGGTIHFEWLGNGLECPVGAEATLAPPDEGQIDAFEIDVEGCQTFGGSYGSCQVTGASAGAPFGLQARKEDVLLTEFAFSLEFDEGCFVSGWEVEGKAEAEITAVPGGEAGFVDSLDLGGEVEITYTGAPIVVTTALKGDPFEVTPGETYSIIQEP